MNGINFNELPVNRLRTYGGANGSKICVIYEGENYMLKYPPKPSKRTMLRYSNSCISEYIGCHIFESVGIPAQETLLGERDGKIVVACKDFTGDGWILHDFISLKNAVVDSEGGGTGTELDHVLGGIHGQELFDPEELELAFWAMFVVDALIANFDRHNGNWGFLAREQTGEVKLAPVFDCGSCLYAQMDEATMQRVLTDRHEMENRLFSIPASALRINGVKINYSDFLQRTDRRLCLQAIIQVGSKIDLSAIERMIDETPYLTELHRQFLKTMVKARFEALIVPAYQRAIELLRESHSNPFAEPER